MKSKTFCSIVLSILAGATVSNVYAETELKIPEFNDRETVEPYTPKSTKAHRMKRSVSEEKTPIYLPKDEVLKIKKVQADYQKVMIAPPSKKFVKNPILHDGVYELGEYDQKVLNSIDNKLNFYRDLARLNKAHITEEDNDIAQHGAIGMASVYKQTHHLSELTKPADMTEDFWVKAGKSTTSSSIHSSTKEMTFNDHLDAFITDYGAGNKETGHRASILGLPVMSFGVGYAEVSKRIEETNNFYTTLHTTDDYKGVSNRYTDDFVTQWPSSGYFPTQLYNKDNPYANDKNMRWSVFFNNNGYKVSEEISVEILNKKTGEKTNVLNDSNGGEVLGFNAEPGYYPLGGYVTVNFKPNNNFQIESNTEYTVTVKGVLKDGKPSDYTYTTRMVDMDAEYVDQDEAEKELATYKETSKPSLSEYKNQSDYRESEQEAITKILEATNTKIDGAKDKATIDTLVKEAKASLDKVKTDKELTAEEAANTAKELATYKETSKTSLSEYKNQSDYRESEQEAITKILEATNTKIDGAKDKATIDTLVKEAKASLDKVKTDKELTAEEAANTAKELATYKETSKTSLSEYKNQSDYRESEQEAITKILEATNTKIDGAKDKATIDTLVKEAKASLDKVKTDKELTAEEAANTAKELATYKETSKTSLSEYKNQSDYRESEQELITKILEATNTKIDRAKDKALIDTLVKEAKSSLDKVKTDKELTAEETATAEKELAAYKETSKTSLSEYKNKSDYRESEQQAITKILEATNTKIDEAKDKASIDTLVKEAKSSLDKVKTDKELTAEETATAEKELAAYKETSKASLSEYKNKSDYRESEQEAINKILEATNTKIDGAKDKASIDTLVKEAKSSLDKVKTDKELTAEEANEAKDLTEYKKISKANLAKYKNKADYRKKQQEQITIILNTTNDKIDDAKTKTSIDALVKEAMTNLDQLKTDKELTAEEISQSSVVYTDAKGSHVLPIDKNAKVKLSVSSKTVTIRVDKEKYKLQDLKEMTLKGFTVDNTVSFNLNGIETVTLDNVKFEKTLNISGTKDLKALVIKNSTLDKMKIHSAPKLTSLTIDKTVFNDDLRIYSNRSLESAVISNSIFRDDLKQYSNHKNYKAQMINNEFKR
ncbi:hypothetical protein [Vagococcus carniphilus]|uniref:hypothetical protein n=1 Tax=Vagococcus carniphilus TaxID=218144 RepID=UPI003BA8E14E